MGDDSLPASMTHCFTVLCQKDPIKGKATESYRPITCLLMMCKFLTGMIAEEMYDCLKQEKLLSEEQKGCRRVSRGTKDQLLIVKTNNKNKNNNSDNQIYWHFDIYSVFRKFTHIFCVCLIILLKYNSST